VISQERCGMRVRLEMPVTVNPKRQEDSRFQLESFVTARQY